LDELTSVVLVAHEGQRDRERAALVALDEASERFPVTLLGSRDERTVFLGFLDAG